jgi:plasmid stabilization system protein ParE
LIINKINFTTDAENDLRESVIWYNTQQKGLGQKLVEEVENVMNRMLENPLQFPKVLKYIYKANIKRFPFTLFYVISDNEIFVLAVFHQSRNPLIWKRQKSK